MKNKTMKSILILISGIVLTIVGNAGVVLYESNTFLDIVTIIFGIMMYAGPILFIVGMILTIQSIDSATTRIITTVFAVSFSLLVATSYGVSMYISDKNSDARREENKRYERAYERCKSIKDERSLAYVNCRSAANELP